MKNVPAFPLRRILANYVQANGLDFKLYLLKDFIACSNHYYNHIKKLN